MSCLTKFYCSVSFAHQYSISNFKIQYYGLAGKSQCTFKQSRKLRTSCIKIIHIICRGPKWSEQLEARSLSVLVCQCVCGGGGGGGGGSSHVSHQGLCLTLILQIQHFIAKLTRLCSYGASPVPDACLSTQISSRSTLFARVKYYFTGPTILCKLYKL